MFAFHLTVCILFIVNAFCNLTKADAAQSAGLTTFVVLVDIGLVIWGFATLPPH